MVDMAIKNYADFKMGQFTFVTGSYKLKFWTTLLIFLFWSLEIRLLIGRLENTDKFSTLILELFCQFQI
jgi:hypothetical protein